MTWLADKVGAQQLRSICDLNSYLFFELIVQAEHNDLPDVWYVHAPKPNDDNILFLTPGSTGFSGVVTHTHCTILSAYYPKGWTVDSTPNQIYLNWVGCDHVAGSLEIEAVDALASSIRPLARTEQFNVVWKRFSPSRVEDLNMTQEKLSHWMDVPGSLVECRKGYQPNGSVGRLAEPKTEGLDGILAHRAPIH
ncbi:hypothetical protein J3A83DRAFT_184427 [Scleroderma citrinum]